MTRRLRVTRLAVLAGLATLFVGAAACSSPTTGQPSAATTGGGQPAGGQSSVGSPSTGAGTDPLPVSQPCSLLSSADLQQVGITGQPTQDKIGTAPTCEADTADFSISVSIFANAGLSTLRASGTVRDITVGSHDAKQVDDNTGASTCLVAIGISDTSSVEVAATGDGNTDPCPTALQVAKLVEPRLP